MTTTEPHRESHREPHRESHRARIRWRFTALYGATLLVVLLAAAFALRQALRATLQQEFEASVRSSVGLVRQFFHTEVHEYRSVEATLSHIAGELVFEDRAIRYRRPDGTLFRATAAATARRAPIRPRTPIHSVRFALDPALAPGWEVEVDASLVNMYALQARIDRWFVVGIPLFVLSAAVAGWWLTGRTLRPVGAMADAAARIAPASGARLPVDNAEDELGRLGLRFNALLDRLDGALTQQRQFLADAAHELRTPIARMRARVELALLEARTDGQPQDATLAAVDAELRAMSQQVEQLLQLARADAAGDTAMATLQPLFLDDLVADEAPRWQPQAAQMERTLAIETLEEAPVLGDARLLTSLVGALVDNALRYTRPGGRVTLVVERDARAPVVRFAVDDDGIGVPDDERARIFDRFHRGTNARAHRADGSGLGLAIAQWIVQQHRGTLEVGTSPLGGARFTVTLPRAS
ncbi:MAG: HAMP domain-containing histidine kinase [Gemmatimonadetes bacterium]|nr:HAMP domain-containing histidine kinase [Gemmatimonadota bacterium]